MINKFLDISNKIFLILFFPSFVTGLFLPNLLCGIFVITNILINFKKFFHLILYYRNIVFLFIIFCVIIFLSSLVSNYTLHSLESSALYITYLFYTFSFFCYLYCVSCKLDIVNIFDIIIILHDLSNCCNAITIFKTNNFDTLCCSSHNP